MHSKKHSTRDDPSLLFRRNQKIEKYTSMVKKILNAVKERVFLI